MAKYIKKDRTSPNITALYWDCKCPEHYIHSILEGKCRHCATVREDGTGSKVCEVIDMFSHKRSNGPDKRYNNEKR